MFRQLAHSPWLFSQFIFLRFLAIFVFIIGCSGAWAQSMTVPGTSTTGQFTITLQNVTTWQIQELLSGTWTTVKSGYNYPSAPPSFTKTNGWYTYRLYNCPPVGGCTTYSPQDISVAISPLAPASVTATASGSSILVNWPIVSGVDHYEWRRDAGSISSVTALQISDATAVVGTYYTYSVRACYLTSCSGWITSATVRIISSSSSSSSSNAAVVQNFTYDALGRLTFVNDSRAAMNRDYDYDPAGNRVNVATNTTIDSASEPGVPTPPTGLVSTYSGNCYFNVYWTASPSSLSVYYIIIDTLNRTKQTTSTRTTTSCTYNMSPPDIRPLSVKACNFAGCSVAVKF